MSKDNLRLLAIILAAAAAVFAFKGGPELLTFSGWPSGEQLQTIIAALGAAFAWWKGREGGSSGAPVLGLLEAIKRIFEQFKSQGIPDEFSLIVRWGEEVYEADWKRRPKVEPKK
jgi:hypothetical protein